jgi:hypothetical protein
VGTDVADWVSSYWFQDWWLVDPSPYGPPPVKIRPVGPPESHEVLTLRYPTGNSGGGGGNNGGGGAVTGAGAGGGGNSSQAPSSWEVHVVVDTLMTGEMVFAWVMQEMILCYV